MKTIILSLILISIPFVLSSQDFEVPKNYKLDNAEDYAPLEQDVVKCFNWLMETPINEQTPKRKDANAFLLKWLSGSPYVHLEIRQEIVTFMGTSPDLLMIFMGGWAKYSLESKDFNNKVAGSLAGIESVIAFYSRNKDLMPKDKNVEKYMRMKDKGELRDYIEDNA